MKVMNGFKYEIRQLSPDDGRDVYEMLQRLGKEENHFQNPAHGMTYREYKEWLIEQDNWSKGKNLPQGYSPQTSYWLYVDDVPVAYGKIRHELNENSRFVGGNIGDAVDPIQRGKGYSTLILRELISIAKNMGIDEILMTVEKFNYASKKAVEKNNGYVFKENELRWYFHVK